jgi:iron complex outermembrane recepter protein
MARLTSLSIALACWSVGWNAHAQTESTDAAQRVVITGSTSSRAADVAGFGDVPLARSPLQTQRVDDSTLNTLGARSTSALTRTDASLSDSYNSEGYWAALSIRGYTLEPRSNYRRDGLPITAETAIALDNKAALEVLKGISGAQAGVSSPGGLVNFVVKRPMQALRSSTVAVTQNGSALVAADVADRFGAHNSQGLRINIAHEKLKPALRNADGERSLLALAADTRLAPGSLAEVEIEWSRRSQPSQPGFSLLGNTLPRAQDIDPRLNLNNQPWSLPVVLEGSTGSLRLTHAVSEHTQLRWHAALQRLHSDDRVAFPFGCSAENRFDRYCSDGSFDLYDFRSEGEQRRTHAMDTSVQSRWQHGDITHHWSAGVLLARQAVDAPPQAFNPAGVGRIDGGLVVPEAPLPLSGGARTRERSAEWYARDRIQFDGAFSLWLGLRHTELKREAKQRFTTPWLALAWKATPQTLVYASTGQGVESVNTPNLPTYTNPGRPLSLKAKQVEIGAKHASGNTEWTVAGFVIERPQSRDVGSSDDGSCNDSPGNCSRVIDGNARHAGIEARGEHRMGAWQMSGNALLLSARQRGSSTPVLNGLTPPNAPKRSLRASLAWLPRDDMNLALHAHHEGPRQVTPANDAQIPAWTRWDATARWTLRSGGLTWLWQAGIDNLTNERAWKEAPYQFGHVYLFPLAPRQWRASLTLQH